MPILPLLVADAVGSKAYGKIISIMMIGQVAGAAIGPVFSGCIYDTSHSYQTALATAIVMYMVGGVAVLLVRGRVSEQPERVRK